MVKTSAQFLKMNLSAEEHEDERRITFGCSVECVLLNSQLEFFFNDTLLFQFLTSAMWGAEGDRVSTDVVKLPLTYKNDVVFTMQDFMGEIVCHGVLSKVSAIPKLGKTSDVKFHFFCNEGISMETRARIEALLAEESVDISIMTLQESIELEDTPKLDYE